MECLPDGEGYLEFNPGALETVRRLYGFDSREDINKAVDVLSQWVQRQSHFNKKDFNRAYLEMLIIECKGSVEKAKVRLDRLCSFRTMFPEFFGDYDVMVDFKAVFEDYMSMAVLPKPTKDNYRILFEKNPGTKSFNGVPLAHIFFRNIFLLLESGRRFDFTVGFELIIDYTTLDIMEVMKNLNLIDLRNGFTILQEGYGLRIKSIHVLTTNKYFHLLHKALTQCFSQKLMSRFHVHASMETVYPFIDKDLLPEDYGGTQKPLAELCKVCTEKLRSEKRRAHIREMLEARTNEALRDKGSQSQEFVNMAGTFRTLTVD